MTRQEAKQKLVDLGIAEPTEEQVSNYLDTLNGETKKERDRADRYKSESERAVDLQKELNEKAAKLQEELDAINSQNLTDIDKANKATEEAIKATENANKEIADLQSKIKKMETLNALAEKGVTGDDAENLIKEDGSLDFETFGKILTEREAAAAANKEAEIAAAATNPNGGNDAAGGESEKPADVANAESISFGGVSDDAQKAKDYYK